jgi:staphylococcal nuclease domain-containing protein 1
MNTADSSVVIHPNGNIAEHLVASGLARIVDWHAGLMGAQGMERLRAAERKAKERRLCLYAAAASASKGVAGTPNPSSKPQAFNGIVSRVWSGDQLSVFDPAGKERKLQLSSVRAAK